MQRISQIILTNDYESLKEEFKNKLKKNIKITFNGKNYTIKTNSKGITKLTINKNIKVGKYNIVTSYGKLTVKNWVKVTK